MSEASARRLFEEAAASEETERSCYSAGGRSHYRWVTVALLSLGMVVIHAQRVNLAVSLLAVSNSGEVIADTSGQKPLLQTPWSALEISLLHSGFFTGYLLTQIPAGIASYHLSAHRAFGGCVAVSCTLNLFLPVMLDKGIYGAVMALRILQGMAEGFLWPASFILVNNWSPLAELHRISGFVATGSYAGAIIGFPVCGSVAHYIGWQYIFYGSGAFGLFWLIFWCIFAYEKPDIHPKVSDSEQLLLRKGKSSRCVFQSWRDVPWRNICSSKPFIALCVCAFAKGWVFNMLLTQEPTYMHVFGFTMAQNGIWSATPFFFKLLVCYASGYLADFLVNRAHLNRTQVRKSFNTFGFGVEAACLFSLGFIYEGTLAIVILATGVSLGGFAISGWQTNHLDLAPQLAGILVAVTQTYSNIAGIFSPLVAGYFIQQSDKLAFAINGDHHMDVYDNDIYGWHMVFLISSLIVALCAVVYALFASGVEQKWEETIPCPEENSLAMTHGSITTSISYQTINSQNDEDLEKE